MAKKKKRDTLSLEPILGQTVENMKSLGTYKMEFAPVIERYCELRMQFDIAKSQWYDSGCKITESYTNKAGATNNRKSALYQVIETLRKELIELEIILGLTPRGLKKAHSGKPPSKGQGVLGKALEELDQ